MCFVEDEIFKSQFILQVRKEESVSELSESELSDKRKSEVESGTYHVRNFSSACCQYNLIIRFSKTNQHLTSNL